MNNVVVFKKVASANFSGFFKGDVSKTWINILACHEVAGILFNNFAGKVKQIFGVVLLLVNDSKIGSKYFASLYVGVIKADKICLKGG